MRLRDGKIVRIKGRLFVRSWSVKARTAVKRYALLVVLCGCAATIRPGATDSIVTERLYFGRNVSDTLGVTDSVWARFVREVVSVQLPSGFTFWAAEGEWRAPNGQTSHEPTFVLEVVHPVPSAAADSAILAIIVEYKRRFSQQSVLRVLTPGRASF